MRRAIATCHFRVSIIIVFEVMVFARIRCFCYKKLKVAAVGQTMINKVGGTESSRKS